MLRSSFAPKLLRVAGSAAILAGMVVAVIGAASLGGRLAGANLALAGGLALVVAQRAQQRSAAPSLEATSTVDFFDPSAADRSFWPDGV